MTVKTKDKNSKTVIMKQTPHIVAFIDFLGAASKMKANSEIDVFPYKMNEIYSTALELLTATEKTNKRMKVRIFSDNILAAAPIGKRDPKTVALEVINFCRFFQTYALCKGFPVRGAITCGNFYSNEIFVYGEALVQAYEMESQRAVYPRIIIDKNICSYMTLNELQQALQNGLILDMDGELSLDFCSPCIHPGNDKLSIENLIKIRNTILSHRYPIIFQKEDVSGSFLRGEIRILPFLQK